MELIELGSRVVWTLSDAHGLCIAESFDGKVVMELAEIDGPEVRAAARVIVEAHNRWVVDYEASPKIEVGSVWEHWRGDRYLVMGLALDHEDREVVVYRLWPKEAVVEGPYPWKEAGAIAWYTRPREDWLTRPRDARFLDPSEATITWRFRRLSEGVIRFV